MKFRYTCVEQLDMAAIELATETPVAGRIALILIDNIVELILYSYAKDRLSRFSLGSLFADPRFPAAKKVDILGQFFDPKVRFAETVSAISSDDALLCHFAHQCRNEAYHTGILHDDIILDLATQYHSFACSLLAQLMPRSLTMSFKDDLPEVIKKHLPHDRRSSHRLLDSATAKSMCESLDKAKPARTLSLPGVLSVSAERRILHLKGGLEYLTKNDPKKRSFDEVLKDVQYWAALFENAPEDGYHLDDPKQRTRWEERKRFMATDWRPTVTNAAISRWLRRAVHIKSEKLVGKALQKYFRLTEDFLRFEEGVDSSCRALDNHIEEMIEEQRMKKHRTKSPAYGEPGACSTPLTPAVEWRA